MATAGDMWTQVGSALASIMFLYAMFQQYFPYDLRRYFSTYSKNLLSQLSPYVSITFHEYSAEHFKRSEGFSAIEIYLASRTSKIAKRLKAEVTKGKQAVNLSMDDYEEVTDEFQGVKVWWSSDKHVPRTPSISYYPSTTERRYYTLTFHNRHRELLVDSYLKHVLKEGKAITVENRQRKLYTNNSSNDWYGRGTRWSHVPFEHPATFDTMALEPTKKREILKDLDKFRQGKDYYAKIGKAWKRGYLLYGPPGTGKSTMIAAMANYLNYDVYDLELTSVKNNTELRKLLIETLSKAIIVIEDIDCSLDFAGKRKKKKEKSEEDEEKDPAKPEDDETDTKQSKVTLSGLLNFIDGIWSACGGEKIILFTTNYLEKLDPALIRRGRMDKHIELSYCSFEAFKVLAKNYLDIESHDMFQPIQCLLDNTKMTPADVAEHLMPKSDTEDAEDCLKTLIEALESAKEEAKKKAQEEEAARLMAEEAGKGKESAAGVEAKEDTKSSSEVKENGAIEDVKTNGQNGSAS